MQVYGFIYCFTCLSTGRHYIGQTINPPERLWRYRRLYCKSQPKLHHALEKYGFDDFVFDLIDCAPNAEILDDMEMLYIWQANSLDNGLNCLPGGRHSRHTDETKRKISEGNQGKIMSEDAKKKISGSNKGKKRSVEVCQKFREMRLGSKRSEETKAKMSASKLGMKRSEEFKNKLRGRIFSQETREKMSIARRNRIIKPETRTKQSIFMKGNHYACKKVPY